MGLRFGGLGDTCQCQDCAKVVPRKSASQIRCRDDMIPLSESDLEFLGVMVRPNSSICNTIPAEMNRLSIKASAAGTSRLWLDAPTRQTEGGAT